MTITATSEQVRSLAPDDASLKAARSLATIKPWSKLGQDGRAIWGACQGSGKDPYLTQIDWEGPAFKCSCPSRKFPCKHGLALLLLLAEQPQHIPTAQTPDWVTTWIASRQQRAETKVAKEAQPVDEAARKQRSDQRANRISDGLDLLDLWLQDFVQQGISSAPSKRFDFWDQQAARLIDAQAPGVARRVRDLARIVSSGEGWQHRLLTAIGRLTLIIEAHRRRDALPASTQADLRTAIGLTTPQEEVLATSPIHDTWFVAGQHTYEEDRLRVQRTWLLGRDTQRPALLLDFAVGNTGFKNTLMAGTECTADLCFFPGAAPLRALVKQIHSSPQPAAQIHTATTATALLQDIGQRIAANPWTESHPAALYAVVPIPGPRQWLLKDQHGAALPCRADETLLALSAGQPVDLFAEWDGETLLPLLVQSSGRLIPLGRNAA